MSDLFSRKELLYAIYEEGSFSRAAQKLYISQPSLSTLVHKLEDEIGLPLFDRTCKPIRLTAAGQEYIRTTEELQHLEKSFFNYVCAVNNLQAGTLAIGSNQLFSTLVLPRYVAQFVQRYPKIQIHLADACSAQLESDILAGKLDLIIDNRQLDPAQFIRQNLCTESLLLAVPAPFAEGCTDPSCRLTRDDVLADRHLSPAFPAANLFDFAEVPFVLMTRDNDTRLRTEEIFRAEEFHPNVILEIDRLVTLYNFITMGTAAAIVSDTLIKNMPPAAQELVFYKLGSAAALRELYIHYKKNRCYSLAVKTFISLLTESETVSISP